MLILFCVVCDFKVKTSINQIANGLCCVESLHEFGTKDLPASIDYILAKTGRTQLMYVGASMGTTMFWVLGAALPEYMRKVTTMVAIAPVARPSHSSLFNSSAKYMAEYATLVSTTTNQKPEGC